MLAKLHLANPRPTAFLVIDLDHFKSINDRFGHAVGDDVLKLFASTANSSLRLTDFIVRLGGEEFAAIMPGTLEEGVIVADRVRKQFEEAARTVSGHYIGATVSVGVAAHETAANIDALLERADIALYAAKANGRNRVEAEAPQFDMLLSSEETESVPPPVPPEGPRWTPDRREAA